MKKDISYEISRPIYSYERLAKKYGEEDISFALLRAIKSKTRLQKPKVKSVLQTIFPLPFLLASFYSYKYLLHDLIAGFTMAVFHIPQGMAYGLLAGLKPINGLYTSFFPVIMYILFGTSRHLSLGTFSIMALLSSVPVLREARLDMQNQFNITGNMSGSIKADYDDAKLQISIATTLLAGIVQAILGIFRLGCIMNFINDSLIAGFICGTTFHVLVSQLGPMLGYSIQRYSGLGEFPYKIYLFAKQIKNIHWFTVSISVTCIVILVLFTELINPRVQKKIKFSLPIQLFVVIIATVSSYYGSFAKRNVKVIGPIPQGLPSPMIPDVTIWPRVLLDGFLLGVVGFVTNSAISKTYVLKFNYEVDYNQEGFAYGLANIFGSFFQCTMSAGALARSAVVVEVGMKSQLASSISCVFMLFILLYIGPVFQHVPTCALSSIIVVSLKSMFMQLTTLPALYKISKYDFNIWVAVFIATLTLNVPFGLVTGFVFSILTVVTRMQNPTSQILGQLPHTNLYQNIKEYKDAKEIPGVKIFRFNAPFYFANSDIFQSKLYGKTGIDPMKIKSVPTVMSKITADEENNHEILLVNDHKDPPSKDIKVIIIDFGSVNYIDNVGLRILKDVYNSYQKAGISLLIANPNYEIRKMLSKSKFAGDNLGNVLFVSIHDAVLNTLRNKEHINNNDRE